MSLGVKRPNSSNYSVLEVFRSFVICCLSAKVVGGPVPVVRKLRSPSFSGRQKTGVVRMLR